MRQEHSPRAGPECIPRQIAHAEDVAGCSLVVTLASQSRADRDRNRTAEGRAMMHASSLQRAVRDALNERGDEEVLDLVDAEPRVGMRLSRGSLTVYEVCGE